MNKLTVILILAVVAFGAWLLLRDAAPSEVTAPAEDVAGALPESPVADLDAELEAIDIGTSDLDLQAVDADLNQL